MLTRFEHARGELMRTPRHWLVTGGAGFIGSNLVETLLKLGQRVTVLDNFATGHRENLQEVGEIVGTEVWASRFSLIEGDIRDAEMCRRAVQGVQHVLHQAALGSVPRSLEDPLTTDAVNIHGFLNMLVAARDEGVSSFVYAASSSTYGDHPGLPKVESEIGRPLSPYAVTKYVNELYADVFRRSYGFGAVGLRYFNVFGPRQDPEGAYAAVIPRWTARMIDGEAVQINGDGETSRDFCFIENVVQANILASLCDDEARGEVFNVAAGGRTSLNKLFECLRENLTRHGVVKIAPPAYGAFRAGDVRHSQADISKAEKLLGYQPTHTFEQGLAEATPWYLASAGWRA